MTKKTQSLLIILSVGVFFILICLIWQGNYQPANKYDNTRWGEGFIEMPGLSAPINSRFEDEITITLLPKGCCIIEIGKERLEGNWSVEGKKFNMRAKNLNNTGTIEERQLVIEDFANYRYRIVLYRLN